MNNIDISKLAHIIIIALGLIIMFTGAIFYDLRQKKVINKEHLKNDAIEEKNQKVRLKRLRNAVIKYPVFSAQTYP